MQVLRVASAFTVIVLSFGCSSKDGADTPSSNAGAGGQPTSSGGAGSTGAVSGGGSAANGGGKTSNGGAGAANAGAANAGTTSGGNAGGVETTGSGLPVPPGPADVPQPTGAAANLKVVPWAGFNAAVTYTFDDSQPSQFEHWPELKATGAPVTYYVTSSNNYIAGFDATLKEVAAKGELGNHTASHCRFNLTECAGAMPAATPEAEMDVCSEYLAGLGAPDSLTLAYPYGDAGYATAAKTRFFLARGVGNGLIGMGDASDPFNLPVFAAAGGEAASVFSGQIDTALAQKKWLIFMFHSLGPTTAAWYATVDIGAVTGSIEHAQGLPDVWLDTVANVGAYWLGASLLKGAGPTWTWTLPPHFPLGKYLRVAVDGGTLKQGNETLAWDPHGYFEVALDAGTLSWSE